MRGALFSLAFLAFAIAAQIVFFADQLPEHVASHFDASGRPDGWSTRAGLLGMYIGLCLFLALAFWVCIALVGRLPVSMMNLPHTDYWLADERRAETILYVQRQLAWFAVGTVLFLAGVMHLILHANVSGAGRLPTAQFWSLFAVYLLLTLLWVLRLILRFRVPRAS